MKTQNGRPEVSYIAGIINSIFLDGSSNKGRDWEFIRKDLISKITHYTDRYIQTKRYIIIKEYDAAHEMYATRILRRINLKTYEDIGQYFIEILEDKGINHTYCDRKWNKYFNIPESLVRDRALGVDNIKKLEKEDIDKLQPIETIDIIAVCIDEFYDD